MNLPAARLWLRALPLAVGGTILVACQHSGRVASASAFPECDSTSIEVACLLQSTERAFSQLESDSDWISVAGEVSIAMAENGQRKRARKYLIEASEKIGKLETPAAQVAAAADLGKAAVDAGFPDIALPLVALGNGHLLRLDPGAKKNDLEGKLALVQAKAGEIDAALERIFSLPEISENHKAFKARSLRELAVVQAKTGDLDAAEKTIAQIKSGLTYYQSTVRSDVAAIAFERGDSNRAIHLLQQAEQIARAQDNGYFIAGALRDIGVAYVDGGMREAAMPFFDDAMIGARNANSNQERARALSRVGTGLADCGLYSEARDVFVEARKFAALAKSDSLRHFSHYEIAGSAAFAGDFVTANKLVATLPETRFDSTSSLKATTQRDIAWGLAKHGRLQEARALIENIATARERIMSLSRVARLVRNPKMRAFPRYL